MGRKLGVVLAFIVVAVGTFFALDLFLGEEPEQTAPEPVPPPPTSAKASVGRPELQPEPQPEPEPEPDPPLKAPGKIRKPVRKIAKKIEAPEEPEELKAVLTVKDTTPPLLSVLTPVDRSYTMNPKVRLTVRSEAGARVEMEGSEFTEKNPGFFQAETVLDPGLNRLAVQAFDPVGNRAEASTRVTYVDPTRIRSKKERFLELLKQLEEVRSAATDIDKRISDLLTAIEYARDAEKVPALSSELRNIRNSRRDIENEIEKSIKEIDFWLSGT